MTSAPPSTALFAARCLLSELARGGLGEACLAPGSRSTPLALALAESAAIRTHVLTDERSLGFFALGIAKAGARPALVVCTSGTAAANLLPAVVEASLAGVSLLVLTADRPPELRDCAAPQTIDQVRLYGSHARWAVDVPILDVGAGAENYYRSLARRALATAGGEQPGPVHLNLPFREPFWDESFTGRSAEAEPGISEAGVERPAGVLQNPSRLGASHTRAVAERLLRAERGLIVCAGQALPTAGIAALAAALDWPILADPLSGLRYGGHDRSRVVDAYDVLLRDEGFRRAHRPDAVLRFGLTPAPRSLQTFLDESRPCDHLLVAPSGWPDPFHACTSVLRSQPALLCRDLVAMLAASGGPAQAPGNALPKAGSGARSDTPDGVRSTATAGAAAAWSTRWLTASRAAREAVDAGLDAVTQCAGDTFEGGIVRAVARALAAAPADSATLFVGNSMPIRDADAFFGQSDKSLRIFANRGASGIDGVISTALGVAATLGATVLVLGDLSFLHDATALAVASRYRLPLVTVVINNDGGGIFSFLPQQGLGALFEPLFAAPHGLDLGAVATALLPGAYDLATDSTQLTAMVRAAIERRQPCVIEIRSDRATAPARNREMIAAAQQAARQAASGAPVWHPAARADAGVLPSAPEPEAD